MLTALLRNLGWLEAVFSWTGPVSRDGSLLHSISTREKVIVCSSRGLTEAGTLFKNLMEILRNVSCCDETLVCWLQLPCLILHIRQFLTSPWEMMKEILLCSVNFRNNLSDLHVLLLLLRGSLFGDMYLNHGVEEKGPKVWGISETKREEKPRCFCCLSMLQLLIVSKKISASFNDCARSFSTLH
ncbi:hypothetical protein Vadar_034204 [Vaccinium darrowii]|uniref:Uncharacterized protein n=1 Tax=Vaccinium darrowii TaxID=229202 RepID=A0ACB7Z8L1_9ERIC|nr:hypothetical protein Vadar_034204 [Vaccinium darrowii]